MRLNPIYEQRVVGVSNDAGQFLFEDAVQQTDCLVLVQLAHGLPPLLRWT
jgi:hypothetical protein